MRSIIIMIAMVVGMLAQEAYACDKKNHPIYCKIVSLKPKIDRDWAFKLSNVIHAEAKRHGMDPMLSVAIMMQESSLDPVNTFHTEEHIDRYCDEKGCYEVVTKKRRVIDMGVAQINVNTARAYGFDLERLFSFDLEYTIKCHFIILRDKIRMCSHLGDEAWTCYHSATEEHRLRYKDLVGRYLK